MEIKSFAGLRNTSPIRSIPDNALSAAFDVDLDDVGILTQRPGYTQSLATPITTAYTTLDWTTYIVSGGYLYLVHDDLSLQRLALSTATAFSDFGKVLFTNDGLRVEGGVAVNIKMPTPDTPPAMSIIKGSMPVGTYSAVFCYVSAAGLEGGSSPAASIYLASPGMPVATAPTPPAGYTTEIYMTACDGTVYYGPEGEQINPMGLVANPFPEKVDTLAWHEGKLFVSHALPDGSTVIWFSSAFHPHIYNTEQDYVIIPGTVLDMASTAQGLIIGTDAAIYLYGDSLEVLATYGVIKGRPFARTPEGTVYMHTEWGTCMGMPFQNLTYNKCSLAPGIQCSTALRYHDGIEQFVVLTDGSGKPFNARS